MSMCFIDSETVHKKCLLRNYVPLKILILSFFFVGQILCQTKHRRIINTGDTNQSSSINQKTQYQKLHRNNKASRTKLFPLKPSPLEAFPKVALCFLLRYLFLRHLQEKDHFLFVFVSTDAPNKENTQEICIGFLQL